jgi:hypothetical protein
MDQTLTSAARRLHCYRCDYGVHRVKYGNRVHLRASSKAIGPKDVSGLFFFYTKPHRQSAIYRPKPSARHVYRSEQKCQLGFARGRNYVGFGVRREPWSVNRAYHPGLVGGYCSMRSMDYFLYHATTLRRVFCKRPPKFHF